MIISFGYFMLLLTLQISFHYNYAFYLCVITMYPLYVRKDFTCTENFGEKRENNKGYVEQEICTIILCMHNHNVK